MKRIIKFRAFNIKNKNTEIFEINNNFDCHVGWLENEILMQFTGVLDLNGKEIYEGDIVRIISQDCTGADVENTFEVIYQAPSFMFKTIKSEIFKTDAVVCFYEDVTVIGNIYEKR